MKHASFFSGVGGLDLGFERAGIHTVSVSEIDPYANAVLAERFPDAPNLGSITEVEANDIPEADIWSGGFPCQDLSVAGKRAGFAGKRSSLAFTFLDLVEQRRPRWLVLENVPGLFSSNNGADFGRLLYEMEQLGYGVSWRTLDARYFGVAQRRRRVFIVASLESDRAGEVLLECEGCERHPSPSQPQRQGASSGVRDGSGVASTLQAHYAKWVDSEGAGGNQLVIGASPDADGMRTANGLARRLDDQPVLVGSLTGGGLDSPQSERIFGTDGQAPTIDTGRAVPTVFRKSARAQTNEDSETWVEGDVANTLNSFDVGDVRTTHAVVSAFNIHSGSVRKDRPEGGMYVNETEQARTLDASGGLNPNKNDGGLAIVGTSQNNEDDLLPVGLDSHRYRCCGNGVVAPVAEWIGRRIVEVDRRWREEGK